MTASVVVFSGEIVVSIVYGAAVTSVLGIYVMFCVDSVTVELESISVATVKVDTSPMIKILIFI